MQLRLSLPAVAALLGSLGAAAAASDHLDVSLYGTVAQIALDSELEYDQNQNGGGSAPTFPDAATLRSRGNRWSAYPLTAGAAVFEDTVLEFAFTLDAETHDGFQAVCLDADRELTGRPDGENGQCFVLASTQGWVRDMVNVNEKTGVGETSQIAIPVGRFFRGPVGYLVFLQDSDGAAEDKLKGDASFSDIKLVRQAPSGLKLAVEGAEEELPPEQYAYTYKGGHQDTADWHLDVTEDGRGVQVNGNQWKAMALNRPYNITHSTLLEFDVVVNDPGDHHAICLDDNLNAEVSTGGTACITLLKHPDVIQYQMTTYLEVGVQRHVVLPVGQIRGLVGDETEEVRYLAFLQDNDVGDKRGGMSTYSNLRLYDEDRAPIKFQLHGAEVAVPNVQDHFTSSLSGTTVQDSRDHMQSVSADGKTVTAYGNSWKRYKLDVPFEVTHATMLKFAFDMPHEAEIFVFCLLAESWNIEGDGRMDCWGLGGKDAANSRHYKVVSPMTQEGERREYAINVGSYFQGPVMYLAFGQDNDMSYTDTRAEGEGSVSDIEVYNMPSLRVGLGDGAVYLPNEQVSYESESQDTRPIRDYLADVSADGAGVAVRGNMWRAFPVSPPVAADDLGDFVVSFDYTLLEPAEIHALCFEENLAMNDGEDTSGNKYDPKRCILLNYFQNIDDDEWWAGYHPAVGEAHRFVLNFRKLPIERFYSWSYLVLIQDNDADRSVGGMEISNLHVTTNLVSCLEDVDFSFQVGDCTIPNFLVGVAAQMDNTAACGADPDPLVELMAHFDARDEMQVYKEIEHICRASYASAYDFEKAISSESQVVREFLDGGTSLNYERDSEGGNLARAGAGIAHVDRHAADRLLSWPEHHALERCDVGAAMCCWVDSRGDGDLAANSDVCYVDMAASRRTAHVAGGYSVYGDTAGAGTARCHGFAWGTDVGSVGDALKGNALFKVGFMDHLYDDLQGNVEQVPGAPLCGCIDRMPVVTQAACTKVTDATSTVDVTYKKATGTYSAKYNMGTIEYADCGSDLNDYYKELVGADSRHAAYIDSRIVGDGKCHDAINVFLGGKGLTKTA